MPSRRRALSPRAAAFTLALALAARGAAAEEGPLEPETAFPVRATVVVQRRAAVGIDLRFAIPNGYYLYRDRFKVEAPGLTRGSLALPEGVVKKDPFVGRSRILRGSVTVRLPLSSPPPAGDYVLRVTAQGCAENRICYAPFTQLVRVALP